LGCCDSVMRTHDEESTAAQQRREACRPCDLRESARDTIPIQTKPDPRSAPLRLAHRLHQIPTRIGEESCVVASALTVPAPLDSSLTPSDYGCPIRHASHERHDGETLCALVRGDVDPAGLGQRGVTHRFAFVGSYSTALTPSSAWSWYRAFW
jgi:hypothetical protein